MPAVCSSSPDSVAKRLNLDVSRQNILSLVELHVQPTKPNTPTDFCSFMPNATLKIAGLKILWMNLSGCHPHSFLTQRIYELLCLSCTDKTTCKVTVTLLYHNRHPLNVFSAGAD